MFLNYENLVYILYITDRWLGGRKPCNKYMITAGYRASRTPSPLTAGVPSGISIPGGGGHVGSEYLSCNTDFVWKFWWASHDCRWRVKAWWAGWWVVPGVAVQCGSWLAGYHFPENSRNILFIFFTSKGGGQGRNKRKKKNRKWRRSRSLLAYTYNGYLFEGLV